MTVETSRNKSGPYNVSANSGTFPRDFPVINESHVRVIRVRDGGETDLTSGIGHTGIGSTNGTVVLTAGIQPGDQVYLLRAVPELQLTDYNAQGRVRTDQVESDFDLATMKIQDLSERQSRALTLGVSAEISGEDALRAAIDAPRYATLAQEAAAAAALWGQFVEASLTSLVTGIRTFPVGSIVLTRAEGYAYQVEAAGSVDFDLATPGGALLKLLQSGGIWPFAAANPGLDGSSDCAPALQRVLRRMAASGGGVLELPNGIMRLNSRVEVALPDTGYAPFNLTIRGRGQMGSVLAVHPGNNSGALKITRTAPDQIVTVERIGFQSHFLIGNLTTRLTATAGIALHIDSTWRPGQPNWSDRPIRNVICRDLLVYNGQWSGGIKIDFAWHPLVNNCFVFLPHWAGQGMSEYPTTWVSPPADGTTAYSFCMDMEKPYIPDIMQCRLNGRANYSCRLWDATAAGEDGFEDFRYIDNEAAAAEVGLCVEHMNLLSTGLGEPGGVISGNHFNARRWNIQIRNHRQVLAFGNYIHLINQPELNNRHKFPDERGFSLHNVSSSSFSSNVFVESGHYAALLDCSTSFFCDAETKSNVFTGNHHSHSGTCYWFNNEDGPNKVSGSHFGADGRFPNRYLVEGGARQSVEMPALTYNAMVSGGGSSAGITYGARSARYVRDGENVEVFFDIEVTAKGSASGLFSMRVVPADLAPTATSPVTIGYIDGYTGTTQVAAGRIDANGDVYLRKTSGIDVQMFDLGTPFRIVGSARYLTKLFTNSGRVS